jgi:hypothetical protein
MILAGSSDCGGHAARRAVQCGELRGRPPRAHPGGGRVIGSSVVENQVPRLISMTGVIIDRQPLALESLERVDFRAPVGLPKTGVTVGPPSNNVFHKQL